MAEALEGRNPAEEAFNKGENIIKNQTLVFEAGDYDDHYVVGIFKVLKSFDYNFELLEYLKIYPEQINRYAGNFRQFIDYLLNKKFLKEIDCEYQSIGAYSTFDMLHKTL